MGLSEDSKGNVVEWMNVNINGITFCLQKKDCMIQYIKEYNILTFGSKDGSIVITIHDKDLVVYQFSTFFWKSENKIANSLDEFYEALKNYGFLDMEDFCKQIKKEKQIKNDNKDENI